MRKEDWQGYKTVQNLSKHNLIATLQLLLTKIQFAPGISALVISSRRKLCEFSIPNPCVFCHLNVVIPSQLLT